MSEELLSRVAALESRVKELELLNERVAAHIAEVCERYGLPDPPEDEEG